MLFLFYTVLVLYQEVLYKVLASTNFYISIVNALFYFVSIASLLTLLTSVFPNRISKHLIRIFTFILSFWYGVAIIVKRTFGITISFSATGMADQFTGGGFISLLLEVVAKNWFVVILVLIPFILSIIISKFYKKGIKLKRIIICVMVMIISFGMFIGSLFVFDTENYGLKDLYFVKRNNKQNVEHFGVLPSLLIDLRKEVTNFEEQIIIDSPPEEEVVIEEPKENVIVYEKQISNTDFNLLADEASNDTIKQMHQYFATETATYKNEYTGLYEGKNLIYIMAESFDGFAVSKELTPTLYKMIHSGFEFNNYYSTTNLSTIGGEFQELTGLLPDLQCLSWKWRESEGYGNYYPYGIANVFKQKGYKTYAYHDHDYTFQDRYKYLKAQGFDNFIGCGNGIENKGVTCSIFPESDDEMILGTYQDYIKDDHFMVYYATVSGHMGWNFKENDMAIKHQDEVVNLECSDTVKAFIAANLELEKAMNDLLQILEENGKLNDTVIVLAADHHPYGLTNEEMNELAKKDLDPVFEIYRNNLIIYNPETKYTPIEKPCATIDILPTTYNLFNIPYDSRLIIGKDILSTTDGLVMFADGSWLTEKGRYDANTQEFISASDSIDIDSYSNRINSIVTNRTLISRNIMYYDYYKTLLQD